MATIPVRVHLETEAGERRISVDAFIRAVQDSEIILSELDRSLAGGKLHWYFTDLRIGSGHAALAGEWEASQDDRVLFDAEYRRSLEIEIPSRFVDGLASLESGAGSWPKDFSERAVEAADRLARLVNGYVKEVRISAPELSKSVRITERISAAVRELQSRQYTDMGSIEGIVQSISAANHPYRFSIRDPLTGRLVQCNFNLDRIDEVRQSLLRRVSVRGQIRYTEDGIPVRLTGLESIEVIEPRGDFDVASLIGIAPDFTEGLPPEEYLRRNWDDGRET